MSFTSTRIYQRLEKLLCEERQHRKPPGCSCTALHRHYGTNIFKCPYPSCSLNRSGFPTHRARKAHVDSHARPWKCPDRSCFYATVGFSSRRDQRNHWEELHQSPEPAGLVSPAQDCFSRADLEVLVFELTKAGDVDGLRRISPHLEWEGWAVRPAALLAAKMGSLPMMEILTQFNQIWSDSESPRYFAALVKSENPALLRWWLDKLCESYPDSERWGVRAYGSLAAEAFCTSSPEMYAEWEDFLLDPARQLGSARAWRTLSGTMLYRDPVTFDEVPTLLPHFGKLSVVFSSSVFSAVKKDALLEARLIQTWHRLIDVVGPLDPRFLGWSLNMLGRSSSHSITMAAELLRLGAPIDFPRGRAGVIPKVQFSPEELEYRWTFDAKGKRVTRHTHAKRYKGRTALHYASRATSERAARFARFLLEEGADPNHGWADVMPVEEKGAALMQKWLGESWDEVVARTKAARQRRKREEGRESGDGLDDEDEEEELPKPKRRRKSRKRQRLPSDGEDEDEDIVPMR